MAFIKTFPCCSATFFPLKANSGGCEVKEICNNYEEGPLPRPFRSDTSRAGGDVCPPDQEPHWNTGWVWAAPRRLPAGDRARERQPCAQEPVTSDPTWVSFYDFHILDVI